MMTASRVEKWPFLVGTHIFLLKKIQKMWQISFFGMENIWEIFVPEECLFSACRKINVSYFFACSNSDINNKKLNCKYTNTRLPQIN